VWAVIDECDAGQLAEAALIWLRDVMVAGTMLRLPSS
jgi:hypothetical protein